MIHYKSISLWCLLLIFNFISDSAFSQDPITASELVMRSLEKNEIGKLYRQLDRPSKKQFSKKQLKQVWKSITDNYGQIENVGKVQLDTSNGNSGTITDVYLEKNSLILLLSFNNEAQISTFRFLPQSYSMPPATKNKVFGKRLLVLKTDSFKLSGELIYPLNVESPPVAILVHGSGPMDMDETIGPNKFFSDLAYELALQGIATFRYTKRSKAYPQNFKNVPFTLADETTDDASSAIQLMRGIEEVDTNQIYILGHSLGAYAAPKIASENQEIAGIVMMAGPYRPLYQLIPMQFEYLFELDDKKRFAKKIMLKRAQKWANLLDERNYGELKKFKHSMVYWPSEFFQDIENYTPSATIQSLKCRTLILQGDRDYQVPYQSEYEAFAEKLHGNDLVTMRLFKHLNHLFMEGEGKSIPSEYMKPGNVSPAVIEAISSWIKADQP